MKTKTLIWRNTAWLLLMVMFTQYGTALATPGLRESIRSQIEKEFEKQYEKETPGMGKSFADRMLEKGADGVKENVVDMLTDFKMGVVRGAKLAYEGNGTIVVVGAKNGWRLFKEYGKAAGVHYVDTVRLLPKKAVKIGKDFGKAGKNIGKLAAKNARHTAEEWKHAGREIKKDAEEFVDGARFINDLAKRGYENAAQDLVHGVRDGAEDAAHWARDVASWTKEQTADAFDDLTSGTVQNIKTSARWTKRTAKFWATETASAAASVNDWSKATWDFTVDATGETWSATKHAGAKVFTKTTDAATDAAQWLGDNTVLPARQSKDAIASVSKWNWRRGWTQGVKGGAQTAANAWENDDKLMATLWTMAGVGKGMLHILLLEPTIVPVLATYGVAGTATLATLGYPSVGAMYLGGTVASGLTYAGGTLATGAVAVGGTAATVVAGGAGVVRTAGTATVGTVATAGTVVGGTVFVAADAGLNTVRTVGTPIAGAVGILGAGVAGGAEMVGSVVYNGAKMAGITALTATGYTILGGYEAAKMTFSAMRAVGVSVFDNAILTPAGVVTNLAQAIATGAWTLVEDPVTGTLDVLAAGGIAIGTIVTSTGAFTYEFIKGVLKGLVNGISAVGYAGIWVIGAIAKGVEFVVSAVNVPEHRRWARFRREETQDVFERIKSSVPSTLSRRFGEIILIRVHWWGDNTGRVRFFIAKNKKTGERWFFKRAVDKRSCEVVYKVTNQDPVVRAFRKNPWNGVYRSGLYHRGCEQKKLSNK